MSTMYKCNDCNKRKVDGQFSKRQLKKGFRRRCKECIEQSRLFSQWYNYNVNYNYNYYDNYDYNYNYNFNYDGYPLGYPPNKTKQSHCHNDENVNKSNLNNSKSDSNKINIANKNQQKSTKKQNIIIKQEKDGVTPKKKTLQLRDGKSFLTKQFTNIFNVNVETCEHYVDILMSYLFSPTDDIKGTYIWAKYYGYKDYDEHTIELLSDYKYKWEYKYKDYYPGDTESKQWTINGTYDINSYQPCRVKNKNNDKLDAFVYNITLNPPSQEDLYIFHAFRSKCDKQNCKMQNFRVKIAIYDRRPFKNELEMCVDDLHNQAQCHSLGCRKFIAIRQ